MSEERKSVKRLLRSAAAYSNSDAPAPGSNWRDAVLMQIGEAGEVAAPPAVREPEAAPLRPRHLLMMSPVGAVLFGLGWWVGRGGVAADEIAAVPPGLWVACAAAVAGLALLWRGMPSLGIGRGR